MSFKKESSSTSKVLLFICFQIIRERSKGILFYISSLLLVKKKMHHSNRHTTPSLPKASATAHPQTVAEEITNPRLPELVKKGGIGLLHSFTHATPIRDTLPSFPKMFNSKNSIQCICTLEMFLPSSLHIFQVLGSHLEDGHGKLYLN